MAGLTVIHIDALSALRTQSDAWDDLWQRSAAFLPTARAALVALWHRHFAAGRRFDAWIVVQDSQWVALLPLVAGRRWGRSIATLPGNLWSMGGDFLLDSAAAGETVCDALADRLKRDCGPLVWFENIPAGAERWRQLIAALRRSGATIAAHERYKIPVVQIGDDWDQYFATRSRGHRRQMRKVSRLAMREVPTEIACHDDLSPDEVEPLMQECFELEASGWKGANRTAVLNHPSIWRFYLEQARQLAAEHSLRLVMLRHQHRTIAFEYGWRAKGRYCSAKVSFDEAFARLSPGQLLRTQLVERLHQRQDTAVYDFLGESTRATDVWATDHYTIDRVAVGLRGVTSRGMVAAWRYLHPLRKRWRRPPSAGQSVKAVVEPSDRQDDAPALQIVASGAADA